MSSGLTRIRFKNASAKSANEPSFYEDFEKLKFVFFKRRIFMRSSKNLLTFFSYMANFLN